MQSYFFLSMNPNLLHKTITTDKKKGGVNSIIHLKFIKMIKYIFKLKNSSTIIYI